MERHGPSRPIQGKGDRADHQEEQVPAEGLAAVRQGEAEFPAVKAAVDTMRDQDEQHRGQDLKAIGKGDEPRPDEQHRHVADEGAGAAQSGGCPGPRRGSRRTRLGATGQAWAQGH